MYTIQNEKNDSTQIRYHSEELRFDLLRRGRAVLPFEKIENGRLLVEQLISHLAYYNIAQRCYRPWK